MVLLIFCLYLHSLWNSLHKYYLILVYFNSLTLLQRQIGVFIRNLLSVISYDIFEYYILSLFRFLNLEIIFHLDITQINK
jgi:hypothetical protein